jgi:hypothetical protein
LANTGDWVGEIVLKLADGSGSLLHSNPNVTAEKLRRSVDLWLDGLL